MALDTGGGAGQRLGPSNFEDTLKYRSTCSIALSPAVVSTTVSNVLPTSMPSHGLPLERFDAGEGGAEGGAAETQDFASWSMNGPLVPLLTDI